MRSWPTLSPGWAVCATLLAFGPAACDRITGLLQQEAPAEVDEDDDDDEPAKVTKREPKPKPPQDDPGDSVAKLERARRRADFLARAVTHLGYNLDTIDGVQSLSGAPEVPAWGVPGTGALRSIRDDDLESGWTCAPDAVHPCVIGFHPTTRGQIRAVRLYAAAAGKAYDKHARIAVVRVHTDEGWFDATFDDGAHYDYVVFGKPIESTALVIEILAYHGPRSAPVFVAELEVYGLGGTPREPLQLDPQRMITEVDGKPWSKAHEGFRLGPSFLEEVLDDGKTRRMLPGSAIYGRAEDAIVLVEALAATDCQTHAGQFYLLNRNSRVQVPIGDMGSMGGQVFRSKDGLGFVGGFVDDVDARVTGVVLEGDSYKNRRTQRLGKVTGPKFLETSGFDREPLPRGGAPTNGIVQGCEVGSDDTLGTLRRATGGEAEAKPGEWMVCALEGGTQAFLTDHGPCGKSWEITVLDSAGVVVARKTAKRKGSRLRVRRWGERELLVEIGGADDDVALMRVAKAGLVPMGARSFAATPPEKCRKTCDDTLLNNSIP